jgi:hypothetical protein
VNHLLIDRGPPIRRCLLGAVVFLVPTAFAYPFTNDPYNTPKLGVLIVGTSAAAALRLYEALWGRPLASLRPLFLSGVAMAAPLMLAWPTSPYRDFATLGEYSRWQGLVPTLVLIGFSLLVAEAFAGRPRTLAWLLASSGAVVGAYGFVQMLGLDPLMFFEFGGVSVATSTLGNTNFTGAFSPSRCRRRCFCGFVPGRGPSERPGSASPSSSLRASFSRPVRGPGPPASVGPP